LGLDKKNYSSIIRLVKYRKPEQKLGGESVNYKKLKLKIKEVFDTQEVFAKAMGMSKTALSQRLNGSVEWKSSEISQACELLHIPIADTHLYFFTRKVQNT